MTGDKPSAWRHLSLLLLAMTIALGVSIRLHGAFDKPVVVHGNEYEHYREAALSLLNGEVPRHMLRKGPAYAPWLALGFWLQQGTEYRQWLLWNCLVMFPCTALALFLAARELLRSRVLAVVPPLLLALWPGHVFLAQLTANEHVVLLGVALTLWGLLRAMRLQTLSAALVGGACLGLGFLIKALFLLAAPLFALFVFVGSRSADRQPDSIRRRLLRVGAYTAGAICVVLPWSLWLSTTLGRPVLTAAYGDLALFVSNQPYGDARYGDGFAARAELVATYNAAKDEAFDHRELSHFAWRYLLHHPGSLLRDVGHNFEAQFRYQGLLGHWLYKHHLHLPRPDTFKWEAAIFYGGLGLCLLGLLSGRGARSASAANAVRVAWIYGYLLLPFVLFLGDARHRLAFVPVMGLLAALYLNSVYEARSFSALIREPWAGFLAGSRRALKALEACLFLPARAPRTSLALLLLSSLAGGFAAWRAPLVVGVEALVSGNARVIASGPLAHPHAVVGFAERTVLERGEESKVSFDATYQLQSNAGIYRLSAVYAAATPLALDVYVNGELQITGAFARCTGGSFNTFAQHEVLGEVTLHDGNNSLRFRQSEDQTAVTPRLGVFQDGEPLQRQLEPVIAAMLLPSKDSIEQALVQQRGATLEESTDVGARLRVDCSYDNNVSVYGPVTELARPLAANKPHALCVPVDLSPGVHAKAWLLPVDESGQRLRELSQRGLITTLHSGFRFLPPVDVQRARILIQLWGRGRVRIGQRAAVRVSLPMPGAEYRGPYIQHLTLKRQ
ncbi:MAG: glycosyltransferase family 39 protein [Planctomycetota bacterium]